MKKTIAFTWWWTWGHIFPIKNLIEIIDIDKYKILWFWNKNSLEEKIACELRKNWRDIIFIPILSWKIRREPWLKAIYLNIIDLFKNILGFCQSFFFILKYQPKFVFSKWGFVAFTPSLAWKILWKKVYLHESDTIPGLVNKLVWIFADRIFLWFKVAKKYFKNRNVEVVGQILADEFYKKISNAKSQEWINDKTNLLVIWWSQWARPIILAVKKLLDAWKLEKFNIFVVWWILNKENIFKNYENVQFFEFLSQNELVQLYQKTDISITRGSATSLAEQECFNIRKIIIPLPYTWWNHQYYNALEYTKKWDILLSQQDKDFINKLYELLKQFEWYNPW